MEKKRNFVDKSVNDSHLRHYYSLVVKPRFKIKLKRRFFSMRKYSNRMLRRF
jgi:hypothetical protein